MASGLQISILRTLLILVATLSVSLPITSVADDGARLHQGADLESFDGDIGELVGVWTPDCDDPTGYFTLINRTHVLTISDSDPDADRERWVSYDSLEESWINDDDLNIERSGEVISWTFEYDDGVEIYEDKRCEDLPPAVSALHGEAVAFFQTTDEMGAACAEGRERCIEALLGFADTARTGGVNEADLSRLIRIAAYYGTIDTTEGTTNISEIATSQAIAVAVAPIAANLIVRGFDYDGDGQLSAAEIATDRGLLDVEGVGPARGVASDLEEQLRENLDQLQNLLRILQ